MKNKIKYLFVSCLSCVFLLLATSSVFGFELGGWHELYGNIGISLNLRSSPTSHSGQRESRVMNGRSQTRTVGTTQWSIRHFTRAQVEARTFFFREIVSDSERIWGSRTTTARSPWINVSTSGTTYRGLTWWGN